MDHEQVKYAQHTMQDTPGSPLFGLDTSADEMSWLAQREEEEQACGGGGGQGQGEFPFLLPIGDIFPSSPPYMSDEESGVGDEAGEPLFSPVSSPSLSPVVEPLYVFPPDTYLSPPSPPPPPPYSPGHWFIDSTSLDYTLLDSFLTSSHGQGQGQQTAVSSFPSSTCPPLSFDYSAPALVPTSSNTSTSAFVDPHSRALAFDNELASPLFSPVEYGLPLEYSPYDGGAADASPCWSDAVCSPAQVFSPIIGGDGGGGGVGMSPEFEQLNLFGSYGGGGRGTVNGADSTGASHATLPQAFPTTVDELLLYSPVVPATLPTPDPAIFSAASASEPLSGRLAPTPSPALHDLDVSPQLLPPPLPLPTSTTLAALPPLPVELAAEAEASSRSVSPPTPELEADDDGDEDYNPSASRSAVKTRESTSSGPSRSTRRVSATARQVSSGSSTSAVPVGLKVALDAPVTHRQYSTVSRTSAKRMPRNLQKQLDSLRARGEEPDEDEFVELARKKREANTLAARRSRAVKAEEREGLVRRVEELERENEGLRGELDRERKRRRVE